MNEDRCKPPSASSPKCWGKVERRVTSSFCSGTSAACDGDTTTGDFFIVESCGGTCDSETAACVGVLGCDVFSCDGNSDLCWAEVEPAHMSFAEAEAYCDGLIAAGTADWRLPTIDEWLQLAKGCDEATGEAQPVSFQSTCTFDPDNDDPLAICESSCPVDEGPTDGCYWPTSMGSCDAVGYWSSTVVDEPLHFSATYNSANSLINSAREAVRCVTNSP